MDKKTEFPTLTELKHSIPNECFESNLGLSLYYTVRAIFNASASVALVYAARSTPFIADSTVLNALVCALYIYVQGVIFWGFFTVGHDCGHSSFSRYHSINFIVGCIMHSAILTPFESWRITHRHHHKNTGNVDKDEIFYPHRGPDDHQDVRQWVYTLGGAWFVYLKVGYAPRTMNHFNPWDPLLIRRASAVIASIASWCAAAAGIAYLTYTYGFAKMGLYYFAPLFVFASFLVITTFLHHNDEATPWYGDAEWNYVKGNLSSVDRSYGWFVDNLSHNIGTHQVHHLFPIIPHYKLHDATAHFAAKYPHLVRKSSEPIISAFFKTAQLYVKYGAVPVNAQHFTLGEAASSATKSA
ncbi:omega-3 fatty acid desaturase, endoplasmic reticulum [Thraustotheca clavata]|uniref:Omega-3 fatty acid desaturase, endoplasmic reticulum n=1 Tax=Thraustotheca clavata TaxID=74557 RepID=A0A1W0A6V2_9STRA|nr:omega-3 fatty acid desaturase, endoplasmic reticulum [Thraustotheca clavata]